LHARSVAVSFLQRQPSSSSGLRFASCCGIRQQQPLRVCLDAPLHAQGLLERADGVVQAEVQRGLLARDLSDEQPRQPQPSRASLRVGAGLRAFHCIYDEG
jgi:hypothetical protein